MSQTIYINPGGTYELNLSRNKFCKLDYTPSKGSTRNIENLLRKYLGDYREETPSTDWPLTPYQQWVIQYLHSEYEHCHPTVRLVAIEDHIINQRDTLRKANYERQRICQESPIHEVAA
jgi:hypothetical protein